MQDFTRMGFYMLFANGVSLESFETIGAKVWPEVVMAGHVSIERAPSTKTSLAFRTLELWKVAAIVRHLMRSQDPF